MSVYLVTYDLRKPARDYAPLIKAIQSYGSAMRVLQSTWFITTNQTTAQARDYLMKFIDRDDGLLVQGCKSEAAWFNTNAGTSDALKRKLEHEA